MCIVDVLFLCKTSTSVLLRASPSIGTFTLRPSIANSVPRIQLRSCPCSIYAHRTLDQTLGDWSSATNGNLWYICGIVAWPNVPKVGLDTNLRLESGRQSLGNTLHMRDTDRSKLCCKQPTRSLSDRFRNAALLMISASKAIRQDLVA